MARTHEGATLTARHRTQQLAVRARALHELTRVWNVWNPADIASYDRMIIAVTAIVRAGHLTSAQIASQYYSAFRTVEDAGGNASVKVADGISSDEIQRNMRATAFVGTLRAVRSGFSPQAALRNGLVQASGSVGRMVLNGGRQTIAETALTDGKAHGFRRVISAGACEFCADIANDGPRATEDSADFQAHDHCACTPEPHFS